MSKMSRADTAGAFEVRVARLEELGRIAELERRVWHELGPAPEELKKRFLLFPQGFLVAARSPDILGLCCALLADQDASEASLNEAFPPRHVPRGSHFFLFGLTVNPLFRRKGIATSLVEEQVGLAVQLGCRKIQLIANSLSRPLFQKVGFAEVRPMPHLFVAHRDLMPDPVLMERRLGNRVS